MALRQDYRYCLKSMAQNVAIQCVISYSFSTENKDLSSPNIFGPLTKGIEKKILERLDSQILAIFQT